jgi:hypothetical protein
VTFSGVELNGLAFLTQQGIFDRLHRPPVADRLLIDALNRQMLKHVFLADAGDVAIHVNLVPNGQSAYAAPTNVDKTTATNMFIDMQNSRTQNPRRENPRPEQSV